MNPADIRARIARAKELSEKATPGYWRQASVKPGEEVWAYYPEGLGGNAGERLLLRLNPHYLSENDTALIAEYRGLTPALAVDCEGLLAEVKKARASEKFWQEERNRSERCGHELALQLREHHRASKLALEDRDAARSTAATMAKERDGLRAKSNLYRGSSDAYRNEVNDLRFQVQRLNKERKPIETERDDMQAQRDAMRANLEHQKAKRLEALAEGDRMRLLVSDLMALFSVSIDHPQAELQLRRRAADAKKGAESWIYDHGERVDWNEDDQIKKPSYADSGRGAVEP